MSTYLVNGSDLTAVANAIRTKGKTSAQLEFPDDFVDAIDDIEASGSSVDTLAVRLGESVFDYQSDKVTSLPPYAFTSSKVRRVSLPNVTTQLAPTVTSGEAQYCFMGCKELISVYLPQMASSTVTTSGWRNCPSYMFNGCANLTYANSDTIGGGNSALGSSAFGGCTSLTICDFKNILNIATLVFVNCTALKTLIFRNSSITKLGNINAFNNTPFTSGGSGGTIYIPKTLYDHLGDGTALDYKTATNWSVLNGYGTITWAQIEGSIYETQYADGTPIAT